MVIPDYIPARWHDRIEVVEDERGLHYLWTGWCNGKGHAKARVDGKIVYVYRWLVEKLLGRKLDRWEYVDHLCERKACLNLDHLEPVTPEINTARGPGRHTQFKPIARICNTELSLTTGG